MFNDDVPPLGRVYPGSRMNFLVLGRTDVRTVTPDVPYLVISITDPDRPDAELAESSQKRDVLRLKFYDTPETDVPGLEGLSLGLPEITETQAQAIVAFVREHSDQAELIVCQCEGGRSRSAAIAAALSRILQNEDAFFFENYWPNKTVYQMVLTAAGAMEQYAAN